MTFGQLLRRIANRKDVNVMCASPEVFEYIQKLRDEKRNRRAKK